VGAPLPAGPRDIPRFATASQGATELVTEVEKIRKELEKWRESGRGFRMETVDRRRQQRIEWRRHYVRICIAKAQEGWRDRCGTERCGVSGSAKLFL
jgi:hypothetical protein